MLVQQNPLEILFFAPDKKKAFWKEKKVILKMKNAYLKAQVRYTQFLRFHQMQFNIDTLFVQMNLSEKRLMGILWIHTDCPSVNSWFKALNENFVNEPA